MGFKPQMHYFFDQFLLEHFQVNIICFSSIYYSYHNFGISSKERSDSSLLQVGSGPLNFQYTDYLRAAKESSGG